MISPDELAFLMILAGSAQGQWRPMKVRVRSCPTADSLSLAREQHGRAPDRRASARPLLKVVHRNRPGRNRTCNPRFWSPLLATPALQRLLIFKDLASGQQRRRCWTTPALTLILALTRPFAASVPRERGACGPALQSR